MVKHAPPSRYNLVMSAVQDDPEGGLPLVEDLARQYPSDSRVRHALGVTLLQTGQPARAARELEAAARREREYPAPIQSALAAAYGSLSMPVHAAQALKRAGEATGDVLEIAGVTGDLPTGARVADLLDFEQGRFEVMFGQTIGGQSADRMRRISAFAQRFPGYLPAQNILATGSYQQGDLKRARAVTQGVLEQVPRNVHALLNLARIELLEHGEDAVRALIPRIEGAAVSDQERAVDGLLARASFYALIGDDRNVRKNLKAWNPDQDARLDNPQSRGLEERLRERQSPGEEGRPPYFTLQALLPPGLLQRWRTLPARKVEAGMTADLLALPGWLSLIPSHLGFGAPEFVRLLTTLLLKADQSSPEGGGPAHTGSPQTGNSATPETPWQDALKRVALHGPGTATARLIVGAELQQRDLLPPDVLAELPGMPAGARLMQLELTDEPAPSPMTGPDLARFEEAVDLMHRGHFDQARSVLGALTERYPDADSAVFNLGIAELQSGSSELKASGQRRIEQLTRTHPDYLHAKVHLAGQAIEQGDLDQARELLGMPEGRTRFHVQEYALLLSAQGRLALAENQTEMAEQALGTIAEILGEESAAYRLLQRDLLKLRAGAPAYRVAKQPARKKPQK